MNEVQKGQNPFDKQNRVEGISHIIAVGSGKGGVGKSTVTALLASSLSQTGAKVGVLDADIYGPSLPRLFGAINQRPNISAEGKIEPLVRHGIKLMSIGFIVDENLAVIWRGPMLFKALDQFFRDVVWGDLDYLLIDLPPGTGDVQLTVAQKVPVSLGISVTTPQNMALADVKKALDMFEKVGVPHFGLVENMSFFLRPNSEEKIDLFPHGELENYLKQQKIEKLTSIPFYPPLAAACETGIPFTLGHPDHLITKEFHAIALRIREFCETRKS